jgi:peptidoglycan/LPS O-acetylase OafA/YrhL
MRGFFWTQLLEKDVSGASRHNCFDLMRHIAALAVLVSHHYALSGLVEPNFSGKFIFGMNAISWGGLAVLIFFSISGYLVTKSFIRSEGFVDYMNKRTRRLFPGLIVCCAILVFLVMPFYNGNHLIAFFDPASWNSFIRSVMLLRLDFPTPVAAFKYHNIMNGSLWTLSSEFLCYVLAAIALGYSKTWRAPAVILALCIAAMLYTLESRSEFIFYQIKSARFLPFLIVFAVGSLMATTESTWNNTKSRIVLAVLSILTLIATSQTKEAYILGNIAIAVSVLAIGTSFKDRLISGKYDISYGIYIYAWPVQQIVINETGLSLYPSLLLTVAITLVLAAASWRFVEKPFLARHAPSRQQSAAVAQ